MKNLLLPLLSVLTMFNVGVGLWGAVRAGAAPATVLSDAQYARAEQIAALVSDFQKELEAVATSAAYRDDEEKATTLRALENRDVRFELAQLRHRRFQQTRNVDDFTAFLAVVEDANPSGTLMHPPAFERIQPATVDARVVSTAAATRVRYADTAKLVRLQSEFRQRSTALLAELH